MGLLGRAVTIISYEAKGPGFESSLFPIFTWMITWEFLKISLNPERFSKYSNHQKSGRGLFWMLNMHPVSKLSGFWALPKNQIIWTGFWKLKQVVWFSNFCLKTGSKIPKFAQTGPLCLDFEWLYHSKSRQLMVSGHQIVWILGSGFRMVTLLHWFPGSLVGTHWPKRSTIFPQWRQRRPRFFVQIKKCFKKTFWITFFVLLI